LLYANYSLYYNILLNSLSSGDKFDIFHWITSDENISTSIHPPLKPKPPLESSYNNLSNGGSNAVITLHKPKQSYIYSPLGQTFWIWYQDNLEYVLNSSEFASYNISEVLRVFKRFRVENFAWIGPLEIFILNFSICRVFTRTRDTHIIPKNLPIILFLYSPKFPNYS
jgi:hypothetical protein